jgi:hypothetical protein
MEDKKGEWKDIAAKFFPSRSGFSIRDKYKKMTQKLA